MPSSRKTSEAKGLRDSRHDLLQSLALHSIAETFDRGPHGRSHLIWAIKVSNEFSLADRVQICCRKLRADLVLELGQMVARHGVDCQSEAIDCGFELLESLQRLCVDRVDLSGV